MTAQLCPGISSAADRAVVVAVGATERSPSRVCQIPLDRSRGAGAVTLRAQQKPGRPLCRQTRQPGTRQECRAAVRHCRVTFGNPVDAADGMRCRCVDTAARRVPGQTPRRAAGRWRDGRSPGAGGRDLTRAPCQCLVRSRKGPRRAFWGLSDPPFTSGRVAARAHGGGRRAGCGSLTVQLTAGSPTSEHF